MWASRSLARAALNTAIFLAVFVVLGHTFFRRSPYPSDEVNTQADAAAGRVETRADKVVVVGKLSAQDTDWISQELPDWSNAIYTVDDNTSTLHTVRNKGHESLPYLQYILDNYSNLPETIAFIHPHQDGYPDAWHTDVPGHSNVVALQNLQIPFVQREGYVNLRCNTDPGCEEATVLRPFRDPPRPDFVAERAITDAWAALFPGVEVPGSVGVACCAQFAVSAGQVLRRPRADYERIRAWVLETEMADEVVGRVMEYSWHMLFGKEAVFCPEKMQCYCDVYAFCNFDGDEGIIARLGAPP